MDREVCLSKALAGHPDLLFLLLEQQAEDPERQGTYSHFHVWLTQQTGSLKSLRRVEACPHPQPRGPCPVI